MDPREIIQGKRQRVPKLIIGLLLVTCISLGGFCGFTEWYLDDGSVDAVRTFEQVTVKRGNIATTLTTSGTAAARESSELNFGSSGVVETIEAMLGEEVNEGDVLASLNNRDAKNSLIIAQNNLLEAELRLSQLLETPTEAVLSEAEKTISSARSQLASAKLNYENALEPPSYSKISLSDANVTQSQSEAASANRQIQSAYTDLKLIQQSFCNFNQIQPEILIDDAEVVWNEVDGTGVSLDLDTGAFVQGNNSLKVKLPHYLLLESVIGHKELERKLDLSNFNQIEFWVRSDTTIETGYFELTLYDSEPFLAPLDVFSIPALEKDVWTLVSSPISKLESDIEVKGVAIKFSADTAQMPSDRTLWLDEIKAIGLSPICIGANLPLSETSIKFLSDTVDATTSSNSIVAEMSRDFIKSNSSYVKTLDSHDVAAANLVSAIAERASLDDPLSESESTQLLAAIEGAEATLTSALRKKDDLLDGPSENEIKLQELNIAKAKQSVDQAQGTLTDMVLLAPFSGQIGAVNISEGVWVTASTSAFSLVNLDSVGVDLTVSESDFIGLAPGDKGMAIFDSIPDQPFIIELGNITSMPEITQGIVTYPAQAEFLNLRQSAEILPRLGSLLQGANGSLITGPIPGMGSGIDIQAIRQCATQLIGRDVSDPSDLTPKEMGQIREECISGNVTEGGRPANLNNSNGTSIKPAIGMNASVTMLLEIKEEVLIVPTRAVQRDNGREVVTVMSQDQTTTTNVRVRTGITNGDQTEIISGLEEGEVVLLPGASNASIPISNPSNRPTNRPGQRGAPR